MDKELLTVAKANSYIARWAAEECWVNLAGSYDYLEEAYYISQEHQNNGHDIHPTCKEMLDAYVPPIFLEKTKLAGLATPSYYISNGYFEPPVIIDPINPFMIKSRVVLKAGREHSIAKSMTRNFTYAICCQELPSGARIRYFRSVLGWSTSRKYRELSTQIWRHFKIPLARVRVIECADGSLLVSDISQVPFAKLGAHEIDHLKELVTWQK